MATENVLDLYERSCAGFGRTLGSVCPDRWHAPTPCAEWSVRQLVNHVTRGNLNYVALAEGGDAAGFVRMRDVDALGDDPCAAYADSVRACAAAFAVPGVLDRVLDYPLGRAPGRQLLAVRTLDSLVHTWDLARAIGADDRLDPELVHWAGTDLDRIYAGLAETPAAPDWRGGRFFATPTRSRPDDEAQARLLHRLGRSG